jgi:hypothetical protein
MKILCSKLALSVLVFFAVAFALPSPSSADATGASVDGIPTVFFDQVLTFSSDTLLADSSDTILTDFTPRSGHYYVFSFGDWEDASGDSVSYQLMIEALNENGRAIYKTAIDTLTDSSAVQILVEFSNIIVGDKYRMWVTGIGDEGAKTVPEDSIHVYRRRIHEYPGR